MRRLFALTVAVALALAMVPAAAMAQDAAEDRPATDDLRARVQAEFEGLHAQAEGDLEDVIDEIKAQAAEAIAERQDHLVELTALVNDAEHLTADHEATLLADTDATASGLAQLGDDIAAATTLEELGDLVPRIATDYRVYLILTPKTIFTIVADAEVAAHSQLSLVADDIDSAIAQAGAAGFDVSKAEDAMAQARAELDGVLEDATGVAASVIDLQAADWPSARPTLEAAHDSLRRGAEHLADAVRHGRAAVSALREAVHG